MTERPFQKVEIIEISPQRFERWRAAARSLGVSGNALAKELDALVQDPTRFRLVRAARAARYAERKTTGDAKLIANVTATEIENDTTPTPSTRRS